MYVSHLKKTVSVLEQGFRNVLSKSMVDNLADTELFQSIYGDTFNSTDGSVYDQDLFFTNIKKYFNVNVNINEMYSIKFPDGTDDSLYGAIQFTDGSILTSFDFYKGGYGRFSIDINGDKSPNIAGRDIFYFNLNSNGTVSPLYQGTWQNNPRVCGAPGGSFDNSTGEGCAARIIENGWVMDY